MTKQILDEKLFGGQGEGEKEPIYPGIGGDFFIEKRKKDLEKEKRKSGKNE